MSKIYELRDYLLENYVDDGDLDISCLDFSEFDGDVLLSGMKVKGNLIKSHCEVGGDLHQGFQVVKGDYYCGGVKVGGNINVINPTKLLKKVTTEELKEMGYEVVDDESNR